MRVKDAFEKLQEIVKIAGIYDIVCGIRGPDSGNVSLKTIFTARLRYLVAGGDIGGGTTRPSEKVNLHILANAVEKLSEADYHYLEHIDLAFHSLAKIFEKKNELRKAVECIFLDNLAIYLLDIIHTNRFLERRRISENIAIWDYDNAFGGINRLLNEYSEFVTDEYPK